MLSIRKKSRYCLFFYTNFPIISALNYYSLITFAFYPIIKKLFEVFILLSLTVLVSCNQKETKVELSNQQKLFEKLVDLEEYANCKLECSSAVNENFFVESYSIGNNSRNTLVVFLEGHEKDGKRMYNLLDKIEVEDIPAKHGLWQGECRLNKAMDKSIFVIYEYEDSEVEYLTKIKKAWKADINTKKINKISTKGIDIVSPGSGV